MEIMHKYTDNDMIFVYDEYFKKTAISTICDVSVKINEVLQGI